MCGITGYWGKGEESTLKNMIHSILHRGPDDEGIFVDGKIGLAQSRLSIIDLSSSGHQPMSNEDQTVWIVFNGEIYNYLELRNNLSKKHYFKSRSDTEVIVHLYEELGEGVFEKLQGMFAIAIYDKKINKLILARDRMGKKPLYWGIFNNTLIFGSELKALLQHNEFVKDIDLSALNKYFLYEYIPTPDTIFKNTYKLEAGTFLSWDGVKVKKSTYWKPNFLPKTSSFDASFEQLDQYLEDSVSDRLVADVPVGIFLSGGIDSSVISWYAKKHSKSKIKTFSIGFKDQSFDESRYARMVANHLGTEHYEKFLNENDCLDLIPKISNLIDEPIADASIIPTYLLSQFAREHVKVILGGDGGDELFCGYDTFTAHKLAKYYEKVPFFIRMIINKLSKYIPTSFSNMSLDYKFKKFVSDFNGKKRYRNQRWLGAFQNDDRRLLFRDNILKQVDTNNEFENIDSYLDVADSDDFYDNLALEYQRLYMMDQVLVKVDRASMLNSLEVRTPFLDTRIVDLANHMPDSFKMNWFKKKYILKRLMKGRLPIQILNRKKKGFGMPIARWMRVELKPFIISNLSKDTLDEIGLFNFDYVQHILMDHMDGNKDNRKQIWTLLMFVLWWKRWVK